MYAIMYNLEKSLSLQKNYFIPFLITIESGSIAFHKIYEIHLGKLSTRIMQVSKYGSLAGISFPEALK